jgi:hypothetical protein
MEHGGVKAALRHPADCTDGAFFILFSIGHARFLWH